MGEKSPGSRAPWTGSRGQGFESPQLHKRTGQRPCPSLGRGAGHGHWTLIGPFSLVPGPETARGRSRPARWALPPSVNVPATDRPGPPPAQSSRRSCRALAERPRKVARSPRDEGELPRRPPHPSPTRFECYTLGKITTGRVETFLKQHAEVSYSRAKHTRTLPNQLF